MVELTTIFFLSSIFLFLVGIAGGWVLGRKNVTRKANLQLAVGTLVTVMWVISIAAEIIIPTYTVSVLVHGIMGAVVGYLFSDKGLTINIGGGDE